MRIRKHIAMLAMLLGAFAVDAAGVSVTARLDSVQMLMGRMNMLHLQVVQPEGRKGGFTIFSQVPPSGYVTVCGDTVELRSSILRDTTKIGSGMEQIDWHVPIQVFDSGTYRLPQFVYISDKDTAFSTELALKVIPVPVKADAQISDFTGPVSPKGKFFDFIPDWMLDLWWLWLLIAVLVVLFIIGFRRYRKQGGIVLRKKPEPDPYQVAMQRLENLKARKLWEQGMEKEYFTFLTDILREYLDKRFAINAIEMTSSEIIASLSNNAEVKEKRGYIREILSVADFVKFAKVRPLPADNISAFDNAVRFLEETKPAPPADNSEEGDAIDPNANIKTGIDVPVKEKKEELSGKQRKEVRDDV